MVISRSDFFAKYNFFVLGWHDVIMTPLWLLIILVIAFLIRNTRYKNDKAAREFFLPGLCLKLFGGFFVGIIYQFYYVGGDTINYFLTARGLVDAFFHSFDDFLVLFGPHDGPTGEHMVVYFNLLERFRSFMPYINDPNAFMVSRVTFFATLFTFESYLASTLLVSCFSFVGVWGLYRVLCAQFPESYKQVGYAVFYIPSVFFWGSGILKDSITLALIGLFIYFIYKLLSKGVYKIHIWALLLFTAYLIFSIKPYILLSILPFLLIWIMIHVRRSIVNPFIRNAITPIILLLTAAGAFVTIQSLGNVTDRFSTDKIFETAVVVKEDLNRADYYADGKGSSYDIGKFDATFESVITLAPTAIVTTLFRPFLWEVRNPLMLLSSLEGVIMFFLFIRTIYLAGLFNFIRKIFQHPFFVFTMGYSLTFAFMVGLSTGNFGNLVRYKIPCIPFFVATILIIAHLGARERTERMNREMSIKTKRREIFSN